ncbi:MAG TPA: AMP-binding protein, partial [Spirochaetota bacterium]|nr:AMP-binding protein [Spirochaetota bacterium]
MSNRIKITGERLNNGEALMSVDYQKGYAEYLEKNPHLAVMAMDRVKKFGDKVALRDRASGEWESFTWNQVGEMIRNTPRALLELNVEEKEMVGIFSPNRAYWTIADLAILSLRAASVPVYATNSASETRFIVDDAEIRIMFVNDQHQYDAAKEVMDNSSYL